MLIFTWLKIYSQLWKHVNCISDHVEEWFWVWHECTSIWWNILLLNWSCHENGLSVSSQSAYIMFYVSTVRWFKHFTFGKSFKTLKAKVYFGFTHMLRYMYSAQIQISSLAYCVHCPIFRTAWHVQCVLLQSFCPVRCFSVEIETN